MDEQSCHNTTRDVCYTACQAIHKLVTWKIGNIHHHDPELVLRAHCHDDEDDNHENTQLLHPRFTMLISLIEVD
jgi:hypothetical protein